MKLTSHIARIISFAIIALAAALVFPCASNAQSLSWWGSDCWFDWSDFRGAIGARYYFARLTSGRVTLQGNGFHLNDVDLAEQRFALQRDPDPFKEVWGIWYIDRLGFRFNLDINDFFGQPTARPLDPLGTTPNGRWELKIDNSRVGIDLDLIRFPFFRFGVDYDFSVNDTKFQRNEEGFKSVYRTDGPMTIGIHALAIPGRIRCIPVTAQARFRFPVPGVNRKHQAKITDWEISGGLRPSIWETSVFGSATFAIGLEGGYRSVDFQMQGELSDHELLLTRGLVLPSQMELKAHWEGAFVQIEIVY